jgi:hypothetical protein
MAPAPTVAGGMVFIGSGYSTIGAQPGNAPLAFAPEYSATIPGLQRFKAADDWLTRAALATFRRKMHVSG